MPTAMKACPTVGCEETIPINTKTCDGCRQEREQRRGTAAQRGYDAHHRKLFRTDVLKNDPTCQCSPDHATHKGRACTNWSTVADHWPMSRKALEAAGLDPNNPQRGRGMCKPCHDHATSQNQPGGLHR